VRVLSVVLLLLAGSYLLVSADAWDPLAGGLGLGAWAVGAFALGLVAQGTRRRGAVVLAAALPAVAVAASLPFSRAEEPVTWGFFMLPLLGLGGAGLVAVAAAVAHATRRAGARTARAVDTAEVAVTVAAAAAFAYGVWLDVRVVERHPDDPATIDDVAGTFRGVGVGDQVSAVRQRLGAPVPARIPARGFGTPLGESRADFVGPSSSDTDLTWRYRGLAILVAGDRTQQLIITDHSAETPEGVGVGDSLSLATREYRHVTCDGELTGSDTVNPSYPYCSGHVAGRTGITFYGDPIESITLDGGAIGPRLRPR
jgi:hypothetical protein